MELRKYLGSFCLYVRYLAAWDGISFGHYLVTFFKQRVFLSRFHRIHKNQENPCRPLKHWKNKKPPIQAVFMKNRNDRIRTCGLCVPNAALYQAEPHSDLPFSLIIIAKVRVIVKSSHKKVCKTLQDYDTCVVSLNRSKRLCALLYCFSNGFVQAVHKDFLIIRTKTQYVK